MVSEIQNRSSYFDATPLYLPFNFLTLISRMQKNASQVGKEKKVAAQKVANVAPKDVGMFLVSKESAARARKKGTD